MFCKEGMIQELNGVKNLYINIIRAELLLLLFLNNILNKCFYNTKEKNEIIIASNFGVKKLVFKIKNTLISKKKKKD